MDTQPIEIDVNDGAIDKESHAIKRYLKKVKMQYRYDIRQFDWQTKEKLFFAEACFLECICGVPGGNICLEAFPNMKGEFYIDNTETGGFRRFRFVKENIVAGEQSFYQYTEWIFESEDGIKCKIAID